LSKSMKPMQQFTVNKDSMIIKRLRENLKINFRNDKIKLHRKSFNNNIRTHQKVLQFCNTRFFG
jgi:hypothetical protein